MGMFYDVIIYDFFNNFDNVCIIVVDLGCLEMIVDKQYFYLYLYSGEMFENLKVQSMSLKNVFYCCEFFWEKYLIIQFDLDFNMVDVSIMSNQFIIKDMIKIQVFIDFMIVLVDSIGRQYFVEVSKGFYCIVVGLMKEDILKMQEVQICDYNVDSLFEVVMLMNKQKIIVLVVGCIENLLSDWGFKSFMMIQNDFSIRKYKIEWYWKIMIFLFCFLFFFIGVFLGGIICKGGLGMFVIVFVFIFIIYYIIDNMGYKMVCDGKWIVWMGMWMSFVILVLFGYFLIYKLNKDFVVLNMDVYIFWFKRVFGVCSV